MENLLETEHSTKTILDLRNLQEQGHLNLEPGFQRKSVWTMRDRRKLIRSIFEHYPMPSIFLYRNEDDGVPVYDVLDGKQRLETIFMFSRVSPFAREGIEVKHQFPGDENPEWWNWRALEKAQRTSDFLMYKIQVAEVRGDFSDIVDLFVRINSTGKALTSSEKRNARFYDSPFLREAKRLASRHGRYLYDHGIVTDAGFERMRDIELMSELLASIGAGGPINKKLAVDKAVGNKAMSSRDLGGAVAELNATFGAMKRIFPDLHATRFNNQAEFYSLFMLVWELRQQNLNLTDRERNDAAMKLLTWFSNGVDEVREQQRKAKGAAAHQRTFADYLLTVQASTDSLPQRKARADKLRSLLGGLFEKKDDQRTFSPEQRRMLWNSDEKKRCSQCGCLLDWTNFQVDHVKAHSRGGKTELSNAALICQPCNASKGARKRRKAK